MKILIVLVCYLNHSSGYFATGYWRIQETVWNTLAARKQSMMCLPSSCCAVYNLRGTKPVNCLQVGAALATFNWYVTEPLLPTLMNELLGYLGLGGVVWLSTSYKMLSNILLSRLVPYIDEIIGDQQCGFRRNRSTIDPIFCIRQILEKKWEYNETVHQLFIDFKKAYDSVRRDVWGTHETSQVD
jgi:hypothetical protein